MNARPLALAALTAVMLLSGKAATAAVIDAVLVDDFVTQQSVIVATAAPPDQTGFFSVGGAATALGGNRDLLVTKTFGAAGQAVSAQVNPSGANLLRVNNGETRGRITVSWDGTDTNPGIDASGLGGIDLSGGLLNPFFELKLTFSDVGGPIVLSVYQQGNAGNFAQGTILAPGLVPSGSSVLLALPFDAFSVTGTATLDQIFGNAGAISMLIDASAVPQEGWDMRLDYVKTRGTVPVELPGSLALLALGLALVARRKA